MEDALYMQRCIELARSGKHTAAPNPLVGCVITYQNNIIGEGWHHKAGDAHAEVNAIRSVKEKALLKKASLYVSLEPCAHYGSTPPCADLIVSHKLKRVVIGCQDPFSKVNGAGIARLNAAGIETETGILENECLALNKHFFTFHKKKRPYIALKWAQTLDGFFDAPRKAGEKGSRWISGPQAKTFVHNLRAEHTAILIGSRTAIHDNPQLTTRLVKGPSPLRLLLDRENKVPVNSKLFQDGAPTVLFTSKPRTLPRAVSQVLVKRSPLTEILDYCREQNKLSLLVEGGAHLHQHFIHAGLWDEAFVLIGPKEFKEGIPAPQIPGTASKQYMLGADLLLNYTNA